MGALAVTGAALAACGRSPSTGAGPATNTKPGKPKRGGTVRLVATTGSSSDNLDPAKELDAFSGFSTGLLYDTLLRVDADLNETPRLASAYSATPDASVWTFRIRDGVKFHNGAKLTSRDIAYTLKRSLDPKVGSGGLGLLSPYLTPSGISTPDATTLKLTLTSPNAFLPQILAQAYFGVLPDGATTFGVGTSAFKLKSFSTSLQNMEVVRFDDYWLSGLPYLDGVTMTTVDDDATRVQTLVSGQADAIIAVPPSAISQLTGKVAPLTIKSGVWYNFCALKQGPYANPLVIEALKYAQDRQKILDIISPGVNVVSADVPIPPDDPFYPAGLAPRPYDPDKAKSLLKRAGFDKGLDAQLWGFPGIQLNEAVAYRQTAAAAGVNVQPMSAPIATYYNDIWLKKPFVTDQWPRVHASVALSQQFFAKSPTNECNFDNPHMEDLVNSALRTTDVATQKRLMGDALEIINDTAGSFSPGWTAYYFGVSNSLKDIFVTEAGGVDLYMDHAYFA
jgi:peptide/nickel transport system substrate-binding protein